MNDVAGLLKLFIPLYSWTACTLKFARMELLNQELFITYWELVWTVEKDLIGLYSSENEGAKFWLSVLTDLKQRGVEDILIACIDGLKGFPEAIEAIFPKTKIQLCSVHQIRTSMRYVAEKDKKLVMEDLKPVYKAVNEEIDYENLLSFEEKWGKKYPLLPNPGWIIGPIFLLSLSTRIRFARLYTPQIRSRECTVRYEKSLSLKEPSAPNRD